MYVRWQHWYMWPLYAATAIKWQFYDDLRDLITGRIGSQRFPRPRGWDLAVFLGGKAVFFSLALGIPLLRHPWWAVLGCYAVASMVLGFLLSVVFQMAHCVEEAEFPLPSRETGRMTSAWAEHQVATSVDFARGNRVLSCLLGGLNFQIEHHLFPRVCHVHYSALSKIVEQACQEMGVRYREHKTLWAGMASHFRWLRKMGLPMTTG
jgi:linoleoyl-CoA desaturase